MARKTFISYKFSEAQALRDTIISALGNDASYYQGETAESPDLTDTTAENIKKNLKDMMHGTSVTIVIVSPNLIDSKWIDWEIEYSLKEISREDQTSRTNGIVCVIMKHNNSYDWLVTNRTESDGCKINNFNDSKLYNIINQNRYNIKGEDRFSCQICKTYSQLDGSYISLIKEEDFIANPSKYIENAYSKSETIEQFNISKVI